MKRANGREQVYPAGAFEAMMHFHPVSDFLPYFRKSFETPWKIFPILPFSKHFLDFHPPKFLMTFLVIDYKFAIPPYFRCFSTFSPYFGKNCISPYFCKFPPDFVKFACFYILYVCFV